MNDLLLAEEIAALLADPAGPYQFVPAIPHILPALAAADDTSRPLLAVYSDPWDHYGSARMGVLICELRSSAGDETVDREHQQRAAAVTAVFAGGIGETEVETQALRRAAVELLRDSLAAHGRVTLVSCGVVGIEHDTDGEDLRSILKIACAWKFQPV